MATYNYHIVTIDIDNEFAVIGDGTDNETCYRIDALSERELEELEYMTSNDLYNFVRNNDATIL